MKLQDFGPNVPLRGFEAARGFHKTNFIPKHHQIKKQDLLTKLGIKIAEPDDPLREQELANQFTSQPENIPAKKEQVLKQRKINSLRAQILAEVEAGRDFIALQMQKYLLGPLIFS